MMESVIFPAMLKEKLIAPVIATHSDSDDYMFSRNEAKVSPAKY